MAVAARHVSAWGSIDATQLIEYSGRRRSNLSFGSAVAGREPILSRLSARTRPWR